MGKKEKNGDVCIITALLYERIVVLRLRVTLPLSHPHETRVTRWGDVLVRKGGGVTRASFDDEFQAWWSQ